MKTLLLAACCADLGAMTSINLANAQNMPWRDGVSRQMGHGHCAKGPAQCVPAGHHPARTVTRMAPVMT